MNENESVNLMNTKGKNKRILYLTEETMNSNTSSMCLRLKKTKKTQKLMFNSDINSEKK